MNICIVGLGLLGGSFALGLREVVDNCHIIGVDINKSHASKALELGIADELMTFSEGVRKADFIVLATPVDVLITQVPGALDNIQDHAFVIDLGSTKELICKTADAHPKRGQYIATHPIAGTENSGPEAAFASLLKGKMMIICDREKTDIDSMEKLSNILTDMNMQLEYMSAEGHDRHIAYVSHLSHISSFALGATVLGIEKNEKNIFIMAGSGFSSTVRLAKSSPAMWAPIFSQNRKNISQALDAYIENLQKFKEILDADNTEESFKYMEETNDIRRVLKGE